MRDEVEACLESCEREEEGWRARFHFPRDLPVFAGHFPGAPLVPAVHLIEAARLALERGLGAPLRLLEVEEARFTAPVGPGDRVEIQVQVAAQDGAFELHARAVVRRGEEVAAKLRLRLGRRAAQC